MLVNSFIIIGILLLILVQNQNNTNSEYFSMCLILLNNFGLNINNAIRHLIYLDINMVSVERMLELSELEPESKEIEKNNQLN